MEGDGTVTEYPGGYSDYKALKALTEKAAEPARTEKPKANVTNIADAPKKKASKLSYKDQRELDQLPAEVEMLSMKISNMEAELSDPDLYAKNFKRFESLSKELEAMRDTLDEKEMRWLELEELRESLDR
ncbi:hypothetical protein [Kordiimonas gwangyangensis]